MPGIFINYRRDDTSAYSRLLYDRLGQEFGQDLVFMDVEAIREPGADFVDAINEGVDKCTVLLALIGKNWLSTGGDGKRRLDDPEDFVRLEIASALKRNVRVVPVVVEGAKIPVADDLPEELKILARRQALTLSHEDWEYDIGKLIDALAKIPEFRDRKVGGGDGPLQPTPVRKGWSTGAMAFTALAAVVIVLVVFGTLIINGNEPGGKGPQQPISNVLLETAPTEPEIPPPEPPVENNKSAYSEEVRTAQQNLAALDYEPGIIDGLMGAATESAIREFQDDEGHPVTGRVNATLLAQLRSALQADKELSNTYQPAPKPNINLSGIWYDDSGTPFFMEHFGDVVRIGAMNVMNQFEEIGNGRIEGNVITIRYNYYGDTGMVVATLSPDGRHLNGTDRGDDGTSELINLHHEHLRGQ